MQKKGCPEGYHGEGDETGQCYSNDTGCDYDGYVLLTDREEGKSDRCAKLDYLCSESEDPTHPACKEN